MRHLTRRVVFAVSSKWTEQWYDQFRRYFWIRTNKTHVHIVLYGLVFQDFSIRSLFQLFVLVLEFSSNNHVLRCSLRTLDMISFNYLSSQSIEHIPTWRFLGGVGVSFLQQHRSCAALKQRHRNAKLNLYQMAYRTSMPSICGRALFGFLKSRRKFHHHFWSLKWKLVAYGEVGDLSSCSASLLFWVHCCHLHTFREVWDFVNWQIQCGHESVTYKRVK